MMKLTRLILHVRQGTYIAGGKMLRTPAAQARANAGVAVLLSRGFPTNHHSFFFDFIRNNPGSSISPSD